MVGQTVQYVYDASDQMISRYVCSGGTVSPTGVLTGASLQQAGYTAYDGGNPYMEVAADASSGYARYVSRRELSGPAVDQVLASETFNHLGQVVDDLWGLADYEGTDRDVVYDNGAAGRARKV